MNTFLATLLPFLFIGSVFSTVAGGGLGVIAVVIGSFFLPVQQNIAVMSVLMTGIQVTKFYHFRGHARWPIVGWYLLLGIPAAFLGSWLLFVLSAEIVERLLGALLLVSALKEFVPRWRMHMRPHPISLAVIGGANGLIGGMIGNAALIRGQMLLALGLSKAEFVGTSTAIALPMNLAKSSVYVTQIAWSQEIVLLFVLGFPLTLAGVFLGKRLLQVVSVECFELLQRVIIIVGAIRFLLF